MAALEKSIFGILAHFDLWAIDELIVVKKCSGTPFVEQLIVETGRGNGLIKWHSKQNVIDKDL